MSGMYYCFGVLNVNYVNAQLCVKVPGSFAESILRILYKRILYKRNRSMEADTGWKRVIDKIDLM